MSPASKRKFRPLTLFDDRGHPDEQNHWESMVPTTSSGRLIRKRLHPAPDINSVDPNFGEVFDPVRDGPELAKIQISHLTPAQQTVLLNLIKKYWRIFSKKGVTVPVKDYQCEIDTVNARPIACKNPTFGPRELPIIKKAIAKLLELGHIRQIFDGPWLSKPLLAPKPHQENVTEIQSFVWRFCVNYVALNSVTKVIAMPIPRCDEAVGNSFGGSKYRWLLDAISGYNQIRVAKSSQCKLAFAGPEASKYTWTVLPFGPVNGPVIFVVFIHDLDSTWQDLARTRGIVFDPKTGTTIIVDDVFSWAPTFKQAIAYMACHSILDQRSEDLWSRILFS